MNDSDILKIEGALSVKLPDAYKRLLIDFPFSEDSFAYTCMVIWDAQALVDANSGFDLHFLIHHRKGRWTPEKKHFFIGNDGGETQYYLDLEDPDSTIYSFDLETGELTPYARGIEEYKAKIIRIDQELEEEERAAEERRKNAKWWEFWKKL